MDKVAEFYARWFAKKAAQEYWVLGSNGAENRFKKSSGSGTDIPGVYSSFFSARIKVARASSIARSKCSEAAA
jgi:hypothetical protein